MKLAFTLFFSTLLLLLSPAWAKKTAVAHAKKPVAAAQSEHPALSQPSELALDGQYDAANPPDRLRVLVAIGPSTYFIKDGKPHGLEFAFLQGFESELNRRRAKNLPPIRLQYIPIDAGELIPALRDGRGDIAAGMLPSSDGLKSLVAVSEPYAKEDWCLIGQAALNFESLAQTPLTLSPASLGRRLLAGEGKSDLNIQDAAVGSQVENILADIDAGKVEQTLAGQATVKLWANQYKNLKQGECLKNTVAWVWAVRKNNQSLADDLNRYLTGKSSITLDRAIELTRRYLPASGKVDRGEKISNVDKLAIFAPIFQAAAAANNIDWLLLAAIGQKESKLSAVIRRNGPTGIMQINPSTARAMGVKDPHGDEGNISAAALYLSYLRKMFGQQGVSEENQLYFMIAAYNAGEGRLQQLRKKAKAQGLDPNVWVGNVERIALSTVSKGMVDYVSTVNRFYLAYQASEKAKERQQAKKEEK